MRLGRRSSCGWRLRGSRLGSRGRTRSASLHWVRLIVQTNDLFGDVDLIGSVENRRILTGGIEHDAVAVFPGVAVNDVDHFSADALEDVLLRGASVFLEVIGAAVALLRQALTLSGQALLFFGAERGARRG